MPTVSSPIGNKGTTETRWHSTIYRERSGHWRWSVARSLVYELIDQQRRNLDDSPEAVRN